MRANLVPKGGVVLESYQPSVAIPQYRIIARSLRRRVVTGEFVEGDRLPSEAELSDEFGVSRMTARQAVTVLVTEGLVRRERGRGAYVASTRIERDLNAITGFFEDFELLGLTPGARVLSRLHRMPTADEQHALRIGPLQEVVCVTRIRTVEGVNFGLQEMTVPLSLVPNIDDIDLERGSFYGYLKKELGLTLTHADQRIESSAEPELSELLQIPEGIPFLKMTRTSFAGPSTPVEYLVSRFRADRYAYHVTLAAPAELPQPK